MFRWSFYLSSAEMLHVDRTNTALEELQRTVWIKVREDSANRIKA